MCIVFMSVTYYSYVWCFHICYIEIETRPSPYQPVYHLETQSRADMSRRMIKLVLLAHTTRLYEMMWSSHIIYNRANSAIIKNVIGLLKWADGLNLNIRSYKRLSHDVLWYNSYHQTKLWERAMFTEHFTSFYLNNRNIPLYLDCPFWYILSTGSELI